MLKKINTSKDAEVSENILNTSTKNKFQQMKNERDHPRLEKWRVLNNCSCASRWLVGEGACPQASLPNFQLRDPHGRKRDSAPSYLLTSSCAPWHVCMSPQWSK